MYSVRRAVGAAVLVAVVVAGALGSWHRRGAAPREGHTPAFAADAAAPSEAASAADLIDAGRESERVSLAPARADVALAPQRTPVVTSDRFQQRTRVFELPELLLEAAEYAQCPQLAPGARDLSDEERNELSDLVSRANAQLEAARHDALIALHRWNAQKVVRLGAGAPVGSKEAALLSDHFAGEDCFLGLFTSAQPPLPDVFVLTLPGESAAVDAAYDAAWSTLEAQQAAIASFFACRTVR